MQTLAGSTISHYRIERLLTHGGMSDIYLGCDTQSDQLVAIKLVASSDSEYCERFRREVQAIVALTHEHILSALDYGEHGPWCYMVTPYIPHGTLYEQLAHGSLTLSASGTILEQLANALQCAHEHGIIHRDIKASNVLMRDSHSIYLVDFGLVKRDGDPHSLTQSGFLVGTPEYIAPELVEGPATVASDIYALGILLYQMLTGRVPFQGSTPLATIWKHLQEQATPPSVLNPAIPYEIDQVVLRALAKNPQDRFLTTQEFAQTYQRALMGDTLTLPMLSLASAQTKVLPFASAYSWLLKSKFRAASLLLAATICLVLFGASFSAFQPRLPKVKPQSIAIARQIYNTPTVTPSPTATQKATVHSSAVQNSFQPATSVQQSQQAQQTQHNVENNNNGQDNNQGDSGDSGDSGDNGQGHDHGNNGQGQGQGHGHKHGPKH